MKGKPAPSSEIFPAERWSVCKAVRVCVMRGDKSSHIQQSRSRIVTTSPVQPDRRVSWAVGSGRHRIEREVADREAAWGRDTEAER
eukprot:3932847-Rhodomonas_salina.4